MHAKAKGARRPSSRQHKSLMRCLEVCARGPVDQLWLTLVLLLLLLLLLLSLTLLLRPEPFYVPGSDGDTVLAAAAAVNFSGATASAGVNAGDGVAEPTIQTRRSRTFFLPYDDGTAEEEEDEGGAGDTDPDLQREALDDTEMQSLRGSYRLYRNACLAGSGTRLQLDRSLGNKTPQRDVALFIAHGGACDSGALSRAMTSLFAWLQQWGLSLGRRNTSRLPLCTSGRGVPCTVTILVAVANAGGGRCGRTDRFRFDRSRLLHWIRVVTGLFDLPPWWGDEGSAADEVAATRYVVVELGTGRMEASTSVKSSPQRAFGCYSHVVRTGEGSPRWFPSTSMAHRFRQRWLRYLHRQRSQTGPLRSDPVQAMTAMWGAQPLSPVLRRMLVGAVMSNTTLAEALGGQDDGGVSGGGKAASLLPARRPGNRLAGAILPRTPAEASSLRNTSALRLTVLLPHATEQHDVEEMVLYLHQKFGQACRIQLFYMYGERPASAALEHVTVSFAHGDYLEFLRVLALTDLLITPHRAALASMVVMQPGSVVVELFPRLCRSSLYLELAVAMRVVYVSHEGEGQAAAKAHPQPGAGSTAGSVAWDVRENVSTPAAVAGTPRRPLRLFHPVSACRHRRTTGVSAARLYHVVKNGLSSVWLRNSRFSGVMAFDRR
ncbi:glycosyltransferase [Trypanosoma conorhini]|uniref:Glycosyltransferase n=1 Tax=Trypanosoma conorhini TaxID=83891 RepID=A0A422QBX3_9TRYP|nr:glycosyltransferase [Trypanosoma conorhini]RNF27481.1 glycosyltransferase [Trypanosoma conorhini]